MGGDKLLPFEVEMGNLVAYVEGGLEANPDSLFIRRLSTLVERVAEAREREFVEMLAECDECELRR